MLCSSWPENYAPQTKILEGGTKDEIRISKEALFKGVSTLFGLRTIAKSVENPDFIFCSSFQNLRLGSINLNVYTPGYHAFRSFMFSFEKTLQNACSTFINLRFGIINSQDDLNSDIKPCRDGCHVDKSNHDMVMLWNCDSSNIDLPQAFT